LDSVAAAQEQWQSEREDTDEEPARVTEDDIAQIVSEWTGVPVKRLTEAETAKLLRMEDALGERHVAPLQDVQGGTDAVRLARDG
jgi:ATP-dependent Clp protease ATP-binding subunit ClpA